MIGRVVSRYRIVEKLGHGSTGVVYKARDLRLERFVALKFLGTSVSDNEAVRMRFMREARAASALDHPNICTIYSIEGAEDGEMFIAMAYYEGENLQHRLARARLDVNQAISFASQIGLALSKAHSHGIVHRDVKPANVMVTRDGVVKLLDFGVALLGGSIRTTQPGLAVGTPAYMSPEQARGEVCDARTDVWALGVVLYEMLTGQLPFRGHHRLAMLNSILEDDPRPIDEFRSRVPPEIQHVISKALEKDPRQRYATAEAVAIMGAMRGIMGQWLIAPDSVDLDAVRDNFIAGLRRSWMP